MGDLSGKTRDELLRRQNEIADTIRDVHTANLPIDEGAADALGRELNQINEELARRGPDAGAPQPSGPTPESVWNAETFPEWREPEPEFSSQLDDEPSARPDGGDPLRPDSVIPDLGWKAPKGPLSDEAEANVDRAGAADAPARPSEGAIAEIRTTTPAERPPSDIPRTQEKPGTGSTEPRPERPWSSPDRPTGQISDETGDYGPERTWYSGDGQTDWNKMNRAPVSKAPRRRIPRAVVGAAAVFAIAALAYMTRPTATVAPAATDAGAVGVGSAPATASAAAASSPSGGTFLYQYTITPLSMSFDGTAIANFSVSMNSSQVAPPGQTYPRDQLMTFAWTADVPCGKFTIPNANDSSAHVEFLTTDARGRTVKCPNGPPWAVTVKLVMRDHWGNEYTRTFAGTTGPERNTQTVGDPITFRRDRP